MFTYLDPIFVYLIDPSITDQGGIDTHRHPFASWYATLQNTPRGHPEQQVRLGKRARTATPPPDPYSLTRFAKKQLACQLVRVTFATWTHLPAICHEHDY